MPRWGERSVAVPLDLRDGLGAAEVSAALLPQFRALCGAIARGDAACATEALARLHEALALACAPVQGPGAVGPGAARPGESGWRGQPTAEVSFDCPDHRLPKVFPCDWVGEARAEVFGRAVAIPIALASDGRGGAPLKSFAQVWCLWSDGATIIQSQ